MARRFASRSIAIFAVLAILLAACSGSTAPSGGAGTGAKAVYGGSVTFAMNSDISNMDPMLSRLFVDRPLMYAMYDSPVRVAPQGGILPALSRVRPRSPHGK